MSGGLVRSLVERLPEPGSVGFGDFVPLTDEILEIVLGAARVAPSADNAQTWRFVTVRSEATRRRLGETVEGEVGEGLSCSAVIVVLCGIQWVVTRVRREQPFVFLDVPIALTHMLLQAAELGLACRWTLAVDEGAVREVLSIPEDVRVVALLGLG
jgi:nitroreductase